MKEVGNEIEDMLGKDTKANCENHGEYNSFEKMKTKCPVCLGIENEKNKLEPLGGYVSPEENAGLPTKYRGVSIADWIADTPEQENVKAKMSLFASGDISRMLVIGSCGTGKTMLAAGIIREMISNRTYPIYTTVPRLIRDIRDSWSKRDNWGNKISEQASMDKYINASVLIVDELGAGRCTEDDKLIFSEILCDRYSEDLPTMLISNLSADAIKETVIDERAADRMREDGEFILMKWDSKRNRRVK